MPCHLVVLRLVPMLVVAMLPQVGLERAQGLAMAVVLLVPVPVPMRVVAKLA